MQHRYLAIATLAALFAAGSVAMAQTTTPPPAQPASPPAHAAAPGWHHGGMSPMAGMHDMRGMHRDHDNGVIGDLHALAHLYQQSGRSKEMVAVYQNVLAKSQDPRVRDYAYHHLARLETQPTNVDQAIATLKKGLDENLANEAKMHAQREQMRAAWQAKRAAATATPATPAAK